MVFGGMELNVVAFAKEAGVLPYYGLILVAWSFGSLVAGAVTGAIIWRASPARRFRVGAIMLTLSCRSVRPSSGGRCPAADPQWHGYCPNPDPHRLVIQSAVDQSRLDRGTCLELDRHGYGCSRRCSGCWLRDRQLQARRLASSLLL